MKEKIPHRITSTDAENAFAEIQHPFLTETFNKLGIEGNYLLILKAIMKTPLCVSYETLKPFL